MFGICERNGQVYTEIMRDERKQTLVGIIGGRISVENVIDTDIGQHMMD
jgi:hypothetical protein